MTGNALPRTAEPAVCPAASRLGCTAGARAGSIGSCPRGGFTGDFATADRERVTVAAFTRRQFADLARATRLAGTFAFLERLVKADFSACGDLYTHRATIARLLTAWFARHTMAEVDAAFAGPREPWARLDLTSRPGPDTEQEEWDDRQSRDPRVGSGPGQRRGVAQ